MLSNLSKALHIIYRIEQDNISYQELIEFLYGETPPENNDFLKYDYSPLTENTTKFGSNRKSPVLFTIIIPTYNRCELLEKTINAIAKQKNVSASEFELMVVDNGSIDKTKDTIENFTKQNREVNVTYIRLKKNCGADLARNIGVLYSVGPLIAFTDDDCIVPPDWLSEFKRELEADPAIAGVGGFKIPRSTKKNLDAYHRFIMWKNFYSPHIRTKEFNLSQNRCGLTANVCYRGDDLRKLGGFNLYFKRIGFQELKTRVHKSGLKLLYEPIMVEHYAYFTLGDHILKLFPQSLGRCLLHKLYPNVWPNPSFLYFLKRTVHDIHKIFTSDKRPPLFNRSLPDIIEFSFISIVTNFFLWFGKYWIIMFG